MKIFTIDDVLTQINMPATLIGAEKRKFNKVGTLKNCDSDSIAWISKSNLSKGWSNRCTANVIICPSALDISDLQPNTKTYILVDDPRLAFSRILQLFAKEPEPGIHPTAFIHDEAVLGKNVYIGPFSYIGKSEIGSNTKIFGHVFIYDNVRIGDRVSIHAGTVIGSDGFGYQKNQEGILEKMPHIGGVLIEDDVEIGANTTIDRGTISDTVIMRYAKIDNLVHVAHNVVVGKGAAVIANSMIGGSTQIGEKAWIAPSATLRDGISIGNDTVIGMGAIVTKSVPSGEIWFGMPAKKMRD